MFTRMRRWLRRFFRQARTVNNEPVNRASLAVIILINLFILFNVFSGLNDISRWPLSPTQAYPCHSSWAEYRSQTQGNPDADILQNSIRLPDQPAGTWQRDFRQGATGHLGQVSPLCLDYAARADGLNTSENREIIDSLTQNQRAIASLEQENQTIRSQYDSTLLEQIAGQPQEQSINQVEASQARATLERNQAEIDRLQQQQQQLQTQLTQTPPSQEFLALLNDDGQFQQLERQFRRASFWRPTVQMLFQGLFLLPLVVMTWGVYRVAERRGYGLIALQAWHLLVIFCIPLVIKLFEVLQFGALFNALSQLVLALFGGLLFLINYLYILLVPLVGYGTIKFFQQVVLNPRLQVAGRVQNQKCIRCAKKLRLGDTHCPHCGFYQEAECGHCHQPTYKYLPYCRYCGTSQNLEL
ncbi:zinc ribbon domain-containing protein [Nodosilinea sp. LEGE 07088]|uniref:zinc ribbon domain-containing protein n=1 Tax=Nodosilinea sp. LEGE 07088 TaxID=2777968 RepID=UPI00187FE580|nr:zinc ribbon domain-containing protein [Nodosilinea sp. LEGE 07088]MBE9136227.1 zinc ribbon domain-containing protein [Nodosilinea sp. LEGE 07088]